MKVLVISHNSFSQTHNNGKTLSAIFSAFQKEELCQLYFTPIGSIDLDRCENYYQITDRDALKSIFKRRHCGTSIICNNTKTASNKKPVKINDATRFARTVIWLFSSWYNGGLEEWVTSQKPDIVFYVGGDAIFSHIIAVALSKKFNLPLVSYFTDDYIINPKQTLYIRILKKYFYTTVKESKALFAIGKQMSDVYTSYFNKTFSPIMNIVNIPENEPVFDLNNNPLKICYFGNIGLGRLDEIKRFGAFMSMNIKNRIDHNYEIILYTFNQLNSYEIERLKDLSISLHKGVSGRDLNEAMKKTDIFLHVESIEKRYRIFTKLSVSTKIPEYMSLGKPIIAYGPAEVASFNVISCANSQLVINDSGHNECKEDSEVINRFIETLNSTHALKEIAHCNYEFAKQCFDKEVVAAKFREEFVSVLCRDIE